MNKDGKYSHLIVDVPIKEDRLGMVAHVYGGEHFQGKDFTPAWVGITAPLYMIKEAHAHPYDEYLFFFGGDMHDITKFDAEADLCMGEEEEKYVITKPTIVYVPAGMMHCPLNFRVVNKPIMFMDISIFPKYERD